MLSSFKYQAESILHPAGCLSGASYFGQNLHSFRREEEESEVVSVAPSPVLQNMRIRMQRRVRIKPPLTQ